MNTQKILRAGEIAKKVKEYAKAIVKSGVPLLEIAEKIEAEIVKHGGNPAFPVNLSINNIAAHYTPSHDDKTLAHGLIKVDFGVHIDGWTADNAFSVDLENSSENKRLIEASRKALEQAQKKIKIGIKLNELGKEIEKTIESHGFSPIINLCGHSMDEYELHAGITIPNIDDEKPIILKEGLYAIEPFTTTGSGRVHDGKPSGIYYLKNEKNVRSPTAREVLKFIIEEYKTLPFCSRWIVKKLGTKSLIGINELEKNGNLHSFPQLIDIPHSKVAQSENTILVEKDKVTVTTE